MTVQVTNALTRKVRIAAADGTRKEFMVEPTEGDQKRASIAARRVDPDIRDRLLPAAED